jgi:hypothetical protein
MKLEIGLFLFWMLLVVLSVGGWIANIVKLVGMDMGGISGMLVLRAIGVVAAPLGSVMGFL